MDTLTDALLMVAAGAMWLVVAVLVFAGYVGVPLFALWILARWLGVL